MRATSLGARDDGPRARARSSAGAGSHLSVHDLLPTSRSSRPRTASQTAVTTRTPRSVRHQYSSHRDHAYWSMRPCSHAHTSGLAVLPSCAHPNVPQSTRATPRRAHPHPSFRRGMTYSPPKNRARHNCDPSCPIPHLHGARAVSYAQWRARLSIFTPSSRPEPRPPAPRQPEMSSRLRVHQPQWRQWLVLPVT